MSLKEPKHHELKEKLCSKLPYGSLCHIIRLFLKKAQRVQPKAEGKRGGEDRHISVLSDLPMNQNIRNRLSPPAVRPEVGV